MTRTGAESAEPTRVRVVLVAPSLPENIGMVARAMRAFGFDDLVLVGGAAPLHSQALASCAGAEAVLRGARTVRTLDEALEGVACSIATTVRPYDRPDLKVAAVRDVVPLALGQPPIAWVFGTERSGLGHENLQRCTLLATIPSTGPSLNLAQAVTVCLYETVLALSATALRHGSAPRTGEDERTGVLPAMSRGAGQQELGAALEHWLIAIGAARQADATSKAHTLIALAARGRASQHEANLLQAIAACLLRPAGEISPSQGR